MRNGNIVQGGMYAIVPMRGMYLSHKNCMSVYTEAIQRVV